MKINFLIRYAELAIKGKNRYDFINQLKINVVKSFKGIISKTQFDFKRDHALISNVDLDDKDLITLILTRVPGIDSISVIDICDSNTESIQDTIKKSLINKKWKSFKVNCKRQDKSFQPKSDIFKLEIAKFVFENFENIKVDVRKPDININIKINKSHTYIFNDKIKCVGGLPANTSGKILMLISGGIDSPVAAYLLTKRGMHVDFLTFTTPPHTQKEVLDKTKSLITIVNQFQGKSKFFNCNFTPILHELAHIKKESYKINLMRREFIRIANQVATENGYLAIATGEAIGQVASQTLESLSTINEVSECLIIRPLISFNKLEIINIAKIIKTYETSILPFEDSCSLFAPKSPITKPRSKISIDIESTIDLLEELRKNVISNITEEIIEVKKYVETI